MNLIYIYSGEETTTTLRNWGINLYIAIMPYIAVLMLYCTDNQQAEKILSSVARSVYHMTTCSGDVKCLHITTLYREQLEQTM